MSNLLKTGIFSVIPTEHVQYHSFLPVFSGSNSSTKTKLQVRKQCAVPCAKNVLPNGWISIKKSNKTKIKLNKLNKNNQTKNKTTPQSNKKRQNLNASDLSSHEWTNCSLLVSIQRKPIHVALCSRTLTVFSSWQLMKPAEQRLWSLYDQGAFFRHSLAAADSKISFFLVMVLLAEFRL